MGKITMFKNTTSLLSIIFLLILAVIGLWNNTQADAEIIAAESKMPDVTEENKVSDATEENKSVTAAVDEDKSMLVTTDETILDNNSNLDEKPLAPVDPYITNEQVFSVSNLDDILVLVNKTHKLPSDYMPGDLTLPNVRFSFEGSHEKQNMREIAARALEELFIAAENEGIYLYAVSGFRSYSLQQSVNKAHVKRLGQAGADKISAKPGHSEHQTGLAMDVSSESVNFSLLKSFGDTVEGKWIAENAHRYGFIIRYEKGKENLTGYNYEPWHLRYVGIDASWDIFENNLTLEAYLSN